MSKPLLNRYEVLQKIASGGMATVSCAFDTVLKRNVAIKIIHPHLLSNQNMMKRFENEARAIASLSHENIIKLFDYGKDGDSPFLVMELVEGKTVQEILESCGNIPNLVALEIFSQIFSGLKAAHDKGIYHRDIKPSNIMIDTEGLVRIMDFGIAHLVHEKSLTTTGTFVGSPNYISPEQASGGKISAKSDVFSAGSVMYECVTRVCPFNEETIHATILAIINKEPQPAQQVNACLLQQIGEHVAACMKKDSGLRPDAAAVLGLIDELCCSEGWTTGKKRIQLFLKDPDEYRRSEARVLWEHYRTKAHSAAGSQPVSALRSFSQARVFADLEKDDWRVLRAIRNGQKRRSFLLVAAGVALSIAVAGMCLAFYKSRSTPTHATDSRYPASSEVALSLLPGDSLSKQTGTAGAETAVEPLSTVSLSADLPEALIPKLPRTASIKAVPAVALSSLRTMPVERSSSKTGSGYLKLLTNPPWAEIFIDGVPVGATPKLIPLSQGSHKLLLRKDGCIDHEESALITAGDTLIRDIALSRRSE